MASTPQAVPQRSLEFLPVGRIRSRGWFSAQLRQDLDGFVGDFPAICDQARRDVFVTGRVSGGDRRHWWDGETEGKWIDGYTRLAHVLDDPAATDRADAYLRRLVDHQDADGYLGIYDHVWRSGGNPCPGDLWTQSLILQALLGQYEASGDALFADAAHRAVLATIDQHEAEGVDPPFTGPAADSMVLAHNLLIVEPVLRLYDITGDSTLLAFARSCYQHYSEAELGWPESDGQLRRISDPALPFIGHGAHTCAQLRVPLLLYYATGDEQYRQAYETGFAKIADCLSVTGACKSDESIGAPDDPGAPLPGAGYEYCAITELLHSLHLALVCTGDLAYADRAERLALNAAQAARQHDGTAVGYFAADNQFVATKAAGTRWDYSPTHDDIAVCCTPSAARFLPYHVSRAVLRTPDDGLLVAFYGPLRATTSVRGVEVTLTADTDYPFDDTVVFEVTTAAPVRFPLRLRVPAWCTTMTVTAGTADVRREGDVHVIDADWSEPVTVRARFDARIQTTRAVDQTLAVERGPLVYALPIPAEAQHTRDYPLPGYHDIDYVPVAGADWEYALLLDSAGDLVHADFTRGSPSPERFPWASSPVSITARALAATTRTDDYFTPMAQNLTLVPVGSTILRRTCFPYVTRRQALASGEYPMRESTP